MCRAAGPKRGESVSRAFLRSLRDERRSVLGRPRPTRGPHSAVLAPEREHTAPAPGRGAAVLAYLLLLQFRITTSVVA